MKRIFRIPVTRAQYEKMSKEEKLALFNIRYFNPHPFGSETGDCVVRAFCAAEDESWDEVYKELCNIGFELKDMPNSKPVIAEYLKRKGYVRYGIRVPKGSKRPTVLEMSKRSEDGKTYICKTAHHIVTCRGGKILDIWNSSDRSLYCFWIKE